MVLSEQDYRLISVIQDGLPLVSHPYAELGKKLGMGEEEGIQRLDRMQREGIMSRFGVVVRHRELGYRANAMVVWDVPDGQVEEVGRVLGAQPWVTLCYLRARHLPQWPYNLYCMVHGRRRDEVKETVGKMAAELGLTGYPHRLLFGVRRFKQRGGRYR